MNSLFQGHFTTYFAGTQTRIDFNVNDDYTVHVNFTSRARPYDFVITQWKKTKDANNPCYAVKRFAHLLLDRYALQTTKFGHVSKEEEYKYDQDQIIEMLKYATLEIFVCIDEIVSTNGSNVLGYCLFHRNKGSTNTYESYIHFVACHCLIQCKYLAPGFNPSPVEFHSTKRNFNQILFNSIKPITLVPEWV